MKRKIKINIELTEKQEEYLQRQNAVGLWNISKNQAVIGQSQ